MSGLIPQHFINDLIARIDIVEVIGKRIEIKKAGKEFKAICPFHDDSNPSLTISSTKGFYHCFSCGAHGTALGFLMDYEHLGFVEAIESLSSDLGIDIPYEKNSKPPKRNNDLFVFMDKIQEHYQNNLKNNKKAIDYLKKRGINGKTAKRFNIGYAPHGWQNILDHFGQSNSEIKQLLSLGLIIKKDNNEHYDRFRNRIIFPIRDNRGRFIGFGGRILNQDQPKYLNSPETPLFHKGKELYGLYECQQAIRNIKKIVVVEGYMDVIGLAQHGVNYAVASMGTATTADHFTRLFRLTDFICFCFDGDQAGLDAAWRALENALPHIREGRQIKFVFLPNGEDPDSYIRNNSAADFEKQLKAGADLSDFLIDKIAQNIDIKSIDGKARLAEKAKPLISQIPKGIFKELIIEKLSEFIGLSPKKLKILITQNAKRNSIKFRNNKVTYNKTAQKKNKESPSIIKKAITLVLNYPEIVKNIDDFSTNDQNKPGTEILKKLIDTIKEEPKINTAGLIERWRDDKEGKYLGQLAITELPENTEFDALTELKNCFLLLEKIYYKERINILIDKQSKNELSAKEKNELGKLIHKSKMKD
jgi:DNA primase